MFSTFMTETLGALMNCRNFIKFLQVDLGRAAILGVPIYTLGVDMSKINDNTYDLTPENYKALSSTSYSGKTMKKEKNNLKMNNIIKESRYTGVGDRSSKRKTFFTITLPKLVENFQNKTFDEIILQEGGVKIIFPSKINDIYTRLEVLLGLNLSGLTDTLTEASDLIDELYKRGEYKTNSNIERLLTNFVPYKWNYLKKY